MESSVSSLLPVIKLALQAKSVLFKRPGTEIEVDMLSTCEPIRNSIIIRTSRDTCAQLLLCVYCCDVIKWALMVPTEAQGGVNSNS